MRAVLRLGFAMSFCAVLGMVGAAAGGTGDAPALVVPASELPLEVMVDLPEGLDADASTPWELREQVAGGVVVPVDLRPAVRTDGAPDEKRLCMVATIRPSAGAGAPRRFELARAGGSDGSSTAAFAWSDVSPASVQLAEGDRPVLVYNHGDVTNLKVPKKDFRRTRGCYVHPIHGLDGEVLTDDFPRDHFHHHGLFWAWPHVQMGDTAYDLWQKPGMRIRFVRWLDRRVGNSSAALGVENGWFVGDRKVMIERFWLTAHAAGDAAQAIDVEGTWIPVDRAITLWGREEKSYGGITIRFAIPRGQNGTITVPDGPSKKDLAMTRLPWADMTHSFGGPSPSGATLMISKSHPDYPPTWLTRHYGPLCVGYPGMEKKTLAPGEPMTLRYRLWIHRGTGSAEQCKKAYEAYAAGEAAKWE